jgi:ribosome-binding factor A
MRHPERLAESLREEIAEVVGFELDDPRLGLVTVTAVEMSNDSRDAKVFVLVEGNDEEKKKVLQALQGAANFVRQQVALSLNLHHAPQLHFARDTVEENASRVGELLFEIGTDENSERTEVSGE